MGADGELRALVRQLTQLQRRLDRATTVGGVMAAIAADGRTVCGYERAVVLAVADGYLLATPSDPLDDDPSDALRRRLLAAPLRLQAGAPEALALDAAGDGTGSRRARPSPLAAALELVDPAFLPLAVGGQVMALLVMDRPADGVDGDVVALYVHAATVALERAIAAERWARMVAEIRYLTASADAMVREAGEARLAVPIDPVSQTTFHTAGAGRPAQSNWREVLSEREFQIAALVSEGLSNREVANRLHLSTETVKGHVSRLLPKLGVSNRVQAATRFRAPPNL